MELTAERVASKAAEYEAAEPLYVVEAESIETLGDAYAAGEYGWRDAMWVVRWYYRRYLGEYPDERRRAGEAAFGDNEFDAIRDAIATAVEADALEDRLGALTALDGVDVPVASAFLMFIDPDRFIVIGDREWGVLAASDHLPADIPDGFSVADYRAYLGACRDLCDEHGYSMWTLYRAVWRLGTE